MSDKNLSDICDDEPAVDVYPLFDEVLQEAKSKIVKKFYYFTNAIVETAWLVPKVSLE